MICKEISDTIQKHEKKEKKNPPENDRKRCRKQRQMVLY